MGLNIFKLYVFKIVINLIIVPNDNLIFIFIIIFHHVLIYFITFNIEILPTAHRSNICEFL